MPFLFLENPVINRCYPIYPTRLTPTSLYTYYLCPTPFILFACPYIYISNIFTHSRTHVKIQILASYHSSFHPHSKTLFVSIRVRCSYHAPQPTPPNLSNPLDIPFASHTYFYSTPKYTLLLTLNQFTQSRNT
jgi:hypothetical protein